MEELIKLYRGARLVGGVGSGVVLNFQHSNLDLSQWEPLLRYQVNSMSKGLIESAAAADSPEKGNGKSARWAFPRVSHRKYAVVIKSKSIKRYRPHRSA